MTESSSSSKPHDQNSNVGAVQPSRQARLVLICPFKSARVAGGRKEWHSEEEEEEDEEEERRKEKRPFTTLRSIPQRCLDGRQISVATLGCFLNALASFKKPLVPVREF